MKKYAALCCYFGKWPNYFQFWLTSCSYNIGIDFYLVTDIDTTPYTIPSNVRFIKKSFSEVKLLIEEKFDILTGRGGVSLEKPYKLCDFKTAYGYIFEDLFRTYEYWGYFDIDTIWGDILSFIPNNEHNQWIKIFPCGHLSFIRNIAPYKRAYQLVNGKGLVTWEQAFTTPQNHYFDEHGGFSPLFKSDKFIDKYYRKVDFDNICPPQWTKWKNFQSINYPEKSHFLVYKYQEGHLYRNYLKGFKVIEEEISYLHISQRKMNIKLDNANEFLFVIYPNSFNYYWDWTLLKVLKYGSPLLINNQNF